MNLIGQVVAEYDRLKTGEFRSDSWQKITAGGYIEPSELRGLAKMIPGHISGASCCVCSN